MANVNVSDITKTFTSYSGCDIFVSFNGITIAECNRVTYSIAREKSPNYTMGDANPKSFTRGKRGIAGSLGFTVFNRDAFLEEMIKGQLRSPQIQTAKANIGSNVNPLSVQDWDDKMNAISRGETVEETREVQVSEMFGYKDPEYADEIMPFDITISMGNEYGQKSVQEILGVEILNSGGGYSVDSSNTEIMYTYIARGITRVRSLTSETFKATF